MITKYLPSLEKFLAIEQQYIEYFKTQGEKDILGRVISNMKGTAELQASQGVDAWLGYGVYLPAVEYIFARYNGENEVDFYIRTRYPQQVVTAYSLPEHDIATLIAADKYSRIHQQQVPVNSPLWPLNDTGDLLDLNAYPQRLKANI